MKCIYS